MTRTIPDRIRPAVIGRCFSRLHHALNRRLCGFFPDVTPYLLDEFLPEATPEWRG